MKKVALVDITNAASGRSNFPLGPMMLKAYARKRLGDAYSIEVKSFFDTSPRVAVDTVLGNRVMGYLHRSSPDVVGFSCYCWNADYIHAILPATRKILPGAKILLGGPEIGPESLRPCVDFVVTGPGEEAFAGLLEHFDGKMDIGDVPNVSYMADGKRVVNPSRPVDPDSLASPFEGAVCDPAHDYYIETSRGCPNSCAFCSWQRDVSLMPEAFVDACFSKLLREWGLRRLTISDSNIGLDREHMHMVARLARKHNTHGTEIKAEAKAEAMDDGAIAAFKAAGITRVDIGIQSTDPGVLRMCGRSWDPDVTRRAVSKMLSQGFAVQLHIIAGMPGDSFFKSAATLKFAEELGTGLIVSNGYIVLKGSRYHREPCLVTPLCTDMSSGCVRTNTQGPMDMERSILFLKAYGKEYSALQAHPVYGETVKYW